MDTPTLLLIIAGGILHYFIVAVIVSTANSSFKRNRLLQAQIELLIRIANNKGITDDEISGIRNSMERQPIM